MTIKEGLSAGINSDTAKELRLALMNDKWHPECKRCMDEEKAGMKSMRNFYDERWGKRFTHEDAVAITETQKLVNYNYDHVLLRHSVRKLV